MKNEPESLALQIQAPDTSPAIVSPLSLIERMIDSGKLTAESVSVVERLVALHEHMQDKNAERDFATDFAAMQKAIPQIRATKSVPDKHGNIRFSFAPYEEIMAQAGPILERHHFSVSFSTDFADGRIIQTCTLQHSSGHHRDYKAFVRAGSGPYGATETQADGAAMTYAKRYALCNALNIVVERDTDGVPDDARNEGTPITPEQVQYLQEQVKETRADEPAFLRFAGVSKYEDIGTGRYSELVKALEKKKGAR